MSWESWTDAEFLAYAEAHAKTDRALFSKEQVARLYTIAGMSPPEDTPGWMELHYDGPEFYIIERAKQFHAVPWDHLDPGIRETVRWLNNLGFRTTDSGDGVSKPEEDRWLDFPHVVIRTDPATLMADSIHLRNVLRSRGVDVGPQGPEGTTPAIEAAFDVGSDVATILLSGVTDATLGLDRHWTGRACGIRSPVETACYAVGDTEPCALCDFNCIAEVVPGPYPSPHRRTEPAPPGDEESEG